jgi:hypothetical protein
MLSVMMLLLLALTASVMSEKHSIQIGILLPDMDISLSQEACYSTNHVRPGIEVAFDRVSKRSFTFEAKFVDSRCSDLYGPVAAMEMFYMGEVHAFFGPCCKYALSPIARYSKVWNLPILTPGGMTSAFSNKTEFPMLTRILAQYESVVAFLLKVLYQFGFSHASLLWHENLFRPGLGNSEWQQVIETIILQMRYYADLFHEPHKDYFDQSRLEAFDWIQILEGISNKSRGNRSDIS